MKPGLTLIYLFMSLISQAQESGTVPYSRDYTFKEGVFLTVDDFKNNKPIPKSSFVSSIPKDQIDFMSQLMELKTIVYKDSTGNEIKMETQNAWGYSQNRTIFIRFNNEFQRMNVIGTLSLFSALLTRTPMASDPMADMYAVNTAYEELHQYIYDTRNNKICDFNAKNMETLLKDDEELYAQFMKQKKRARSESIFIYLRKYNEKHPLYLAVR